MARPKNYHVSEATRAKLRATIAAQRNNFVPRPQRKPNPGPAKKLLELMQKALLTTDSL